MNSSAVRIRFLRGRHTDRSTMMSSSYLQPVHTLVSASVNIVCCGLGDEPCCKVDQAEREEEGVQRQSQDTRGQVRPVNEPLTACEPSIAPPCYKCMSQHHVHVVQRSRCAQQVPRPQHGTTNGTQATPHCCHGQPTRSRRLGLVKSVRKHIRHGDMVKLPTRQRCGE